MADILDKELRFKIKDFLQWAFVRTMQFYEEHMNGEESAKAELALKHIGILLKLADAAQIPDEDGDGMELAALIQQASAEVDKYHERKGNV